MPIDASIYSQIRQPEQFNPLAEAAQFQQLQGLQNQNKLAALGFQDRERAIVDANAEREAVRGFGDDTTANFNRLMMTGNRAAAQDYLKKVQEGKRYEAETTQKGVETGTKAFDQYKAMLSSAQSPDQAARLMAASFSDPTIGPLLGRFGTLEESMQDLQKAAASPQGFAEWKAMAAIGMGELAKMAKVQNVNLGGTMQTQSVQPATGQVTQLASAPITQSADNRASVGASMANAAAVRDAAKLQSDATRSAANAQRDQATEMKLADDYRAQSKEFGSSKSAYEQLTSTLDSATTSPAATLAAATKFMKMLDPGSVVRESELGMALAASGVIDRAMNYVSTLQSGRKLTETQAADFKKISKQVYNAAQRVQQTIDDDYKSKAKAYGLRPEMVTQDLGQNANVTSWGDLK